MHFYYPKISDLSLEKALSLEWIDTNGLGGYSSSSLINCHTRKYHGLLVSKLDNLPDKYVLLSKVEDILIQDGKENYLTASLYPNFLQDGSWDNLQEFKLTTHPTWNFKFNDLLLTKEILLLHENNTVLIKYTVNSNSRFKIILRPLFASRNFHGLQQENFEYQCDCENLPDGFSCILNHGMPKIFFQTDVEHDFLVNHIWYRNFIYPEEKKRGYDFQEDLFSPGMFVFNPESKREIICACSISQQKSDLATKWRKELERRAKSCTECGGTKNVFVEQLQNVGQSFIIKSKSATKTQSIVAGYHWFLEWGRDAMIALPGLTLYNGQENVCLAVLKNFASYEANGLIPNILGATKASSLYNTVDASLWFVWAIQQYYLKTKNLNEVIASFWPVMKNIFYFYKKGTLYDIKMQEDGLLYAGNPDINLTWMDAKVAGKPITPRYGNQVEVNALWFNMLSFMVELVSITKDLMEQELQHLVCQVRASFREKFWCEEKGYLYDFVNSSEKNLAIRPNQIFAVSLPYSPLLMKMAVSIMAIVKEHLLTPYGLRTLSKRDCKYVGIYQGNQQERDYAYHNGTVWPWLLGHFTEALLKITSDRRKVITIINPCLEALQKHLTEYGIGSIAEVFSGDLPHYPNGCISQAWSVAEILRLTYLLGIDRTRH